MTETMPSLIPSEMDEQLAVAVVRYIPEGMRDGLLLYLRYGVPPGHFLLAVLSNDLEAAVMRADDVNRPMLATYIDVLVNYAPATAFGSRENVRAWMDDGARLRRQHLAEQS